MKVARSHAVCFLFISILLSFISKGNFSNDREIDVDEMREETRQAFLHAYHSYMNHGELHFAETYNINPVV